MRRVRVDQARAAHAAKRGGHHQRVDLESGLAATPGPSVDLVALDEALDRLGAVDEDLARLVEWRFFAGLSVEEIADLSGRSVRTLKRHWQTARAFLYQELSAPDHAP